MEGCEQPERVVVLHVVAYTAVIAAPSASLRFTSGVGDTVARADRGTALQSDRGDHRRYPDAPPGTCSRTSDAGHQVDPDRTLVDEAIAGSLDAFDTLVRRYQTRLVNYALAIIRDSGEAEDVAQETFIRAYRSLGRFRGESSFKTWLYTIATNTARTALERRGRRERVGDQSLDDETQTLSAGSVPSGLPDPEATLVTRDAIDRALATLSDDLRVAVVLRDVEGLDYREIAEVTGSPIGTVESRIFRARQRLRVLLRSLRLTSDPIASR